MINIEIKARCPDTARAAERLNELGAGMAGVFEQRDTYFNVDRGRLKLREQAQGEGHLIYYVREDAAGPKRSDYQIAPTSEPEILRQMLAEVLGVRVEVTKTRQVWLWENVRVHLDEVAGLGRFVELEAVTDEAGAADSRERVETLMSALGIQRGLLVEGSYADLVAAG